MREALACSPIHRQCHRGGRTGRRSTRDSEIDAPDTRKKCRQEEIRWAEDVRPHALSIFAERTTRLTWSGPLLRELLAQLYVVGERAPNDEFTNLVGSFEALTVRRYPQAIAVACAMAFENGDEFLAKGSPTPAKRQ